MTVADSALASAVEQQITGLLKSLSFEDVIGRCNTLERTGCTLAWLLIQLGKREDECSHLKLFQTMIHRGAWLRAGRRRSALPMRAGKLEGTIQFFSSHLLDDCLTTQALHAHGKSSWMVLACYACNSLMECQHPLPSGQWTKDEEVAGGAVAKAVDRLLEHSQDVSVSIAAIEKDLKLTRVTYAGEEVGTCHPLSLEQVEPALPPAEHGGCINLVDFVSPFTRRMLLEPERCILPDKGQPLPKLQGRIHMNQNERERISDLLVERGVCRWTPLKDVLTYRGERVLNGLFGVEKSSLTASGRPVLRLIMNLVPSNSVMLQMEGATSRLPTITSWMSIVGDGSDHLKVWQSDMSNAFYLFQLPKVWSNYLSFNVIRNGKSLGLSTDEDFALSCAVLPMGWLSSVAIMQELSEYLLLHDALNSETQLVRNKPLPLWMVGLLRDSRRDKRCWWHVYLDNFCAGQLVHGGEKGQGGDDLHQAAEASWARSKVLSSAKKRKSGILWAEELGALIDGQGMTLGASGERLLKLIHATLWVLGRNHLAKKHVQILAGRWVHALSFRRAGMSFLDYTWEYIGTKRFSSELVGRVKRELFALVASTPLLHTNLNAEIHNFITASDASNTGGAMGIAECLTEEGGNYATAMQTIQPLLQTIPVMVISLFNGIGGCFRCYDILGLSPQCQVSFEIHEPSNRVTARRWPQTMMYHDVRELDRELFLTLLLKAVGIREIHIWAGFPCTDLSSAKAFREGLSGKDSRLFFEFKRILALARQEAEPLIQVKYVGENVASMSKQDCDEIGSHLGVWPYHFNCSDAVPMNRPRLCWTSEALEGCLQGLTFEADDHWTWVTAPNPYPPLETWIEEDTEWPGGSAGEILPTAMKAIVRQRPPPRPAGLHRCDEATKSRWAAEAYKFPPYHYLDRFIFWKGDKWRLCSSEERELLMGYGWHHTEVCMSASKIKQSKAKYENERLSLLGDSFSIFSFVIPAASMCKNYLPQLHYQHLANRMGLAPGFRAPWKLTAPIGRCLKYGDELWGEPEAVSTVNRLLLSKVNHTGSDIRVTTGEVLNPKAFPRQAVEAAWWLWKPVFSFRWKSPDHINAQELRAIFRSLLHILRQKRICNSRLFHLTDSYVCLSIVSKGRSGSRLLNRILKCLNAHLLLYNVYLVLGHVESLQNPTDGASRET